MKAATILALFVALSLNGEPPKGVRTGNFSVYNVEIGAYDEKQNAPFNSKLALRVDAITGDTWAFMLVIGKTNNTMAWVPVPTMIPVQTNQSPRLQ